MKDMDLKNPKKKGREEMKEMKEKRVFMFDDM